MHSLDRKVVDFLGNFDVLGIQAVVVMVVAQSVPVSLPVIFLVQAFVHLVQIVLVGNVLVETDAAF